jgi:hypothetical protein
MIIGLKTQRQAHTELESFFPQRRKFGILGALTFIGIALGDRLQP